MYISSKLISSIPQTIDWIHGNPKATLTEINLKKAELSDIGQSPTEDVRQHDQREQLAIARRDLEDLAYHVKSKFEYDRSTQKVTHVQKVSFQYLIYFN